ncbi:MAG: hypothetical protein Kow0020_11040 [Wenzhouxiangellaceae bacterium]
MLACVLYPTLLWASPPDLPEPRSNNPVARLAEAEFWFTGLGLASGKTWQNLRADGWVWREGDAGWQPVPPLPAHQGLAGRLGSHAVAVNGSILVIGGYTVAADGTERSTPGIWRLSIEGPPHWSRAASMPVPVDDALALVYRNRYVYLVSGWSDTGNVNLVQIWDAVAHHWRQAEPWPGDPVFGHSGAMMGDRMVVCGGARIEYPSSGPRRFVASDGCWLGTIRNEDARRLDWKPLPPMPGGARYRAAAVGIHAAGADRIVFAGGADRPYNYDGQGYDGVPARALSAVVSYDLDAGHWACHQAMPAARMDLRGMVVADGKLVVVGGMSSEREVVAEVLSFELSAPQACDAGALR